MCGIFALSKKRDNSSLAFFSSGSSLSGIAAAALKSMGHRGPDGSRYEILENGELVLGQTRLSIIGLDDPPQPIVNEDGTVIAVVNGELYDFERIRSELISLEHRFSTSCDSEIAIHLYEEHDLDFVRFMRGEFAFVLWDSRKKRLIAGRDRFGIKPLVYFENSEMILLASEAKAIFAAGIPAKWDMSSLYSAFSMQYTLPDRTLFEGVRQLPPGHMLIVENNISRLYRYWELDYSSLAEKASEAELIEEFAHSLSESVNLRLRSDAPLCFHLSGGIDSASVLALGSEKLSAPAHCFTVSFPGSSYDELAYASAMAKLCGAVLHVVEVTDEDILGNIDEAVYKSEGLAVNGHLSSKFLLHKSIRENGFKVALTGEGADELLGGYAHLRQDLAACGWGDNLLEAELEKTNSASLGIMLAEGEGLDLDSVSSILGYIPSFLRAKSTLGQKMHSILQKDFLESFSGVDAYSALLGSPFIRSALEYGKQYSNEAERRFYSSMSLWSKTALSGYILRTLGDGTEMAHSVEGRVPFLDHKLFELGRRLPLELQIRDGVEKYILRQSMRNRLTAEIFEKQKHPFVAPPLSRFASSSAFSFLQERLAGAEALEIPFVDHVKLSRLISDLKNESLEKRSAYDPVLMMVLSLQAIKKRFAIA